MSECASGATALDARDECSVTNHVLQALVPEALSRPEEFTSEDLGFIADACSRFGRVQTVVYFQSS